MNLNTNERDYYESLLAKISTLPHGLSFKITQLFDKDPVSPRICRKFYEDVKSDNITNIRLNGTRSIEGYTVI